MKGPCKKVQKNEDQEGEAAATGPQAETLEAKKSWTANSHSALETEGTHGLGERVMADLYLESCRANSVVPVSRLLRQGSASELNLQHRGLGPQGIRALASTLTSNLYIKRLDLRDNELGGAGAEALADVLRKNSVISDVDLSENQIGAAGLQAICTALALNTTVQKMQLQGNRLEEKAAQHLAALLLRHTGLKSLDLSYNQLNDLAGETLGPAVAENTGLTELNLSWNHLRGLGAIAFARGLEANIFLKVLDISHNGFGDSGACAVGEALRVNNVLEELNMRNNRISTSGALKLGLGLQVNQTLRVLILLSSTISPPVTLEPRPISSSGPHFQPPARQSSSHSESQNPTWLNYLLLKISKNPICNDGCVGLLKSIRSNKSSGLELLDVSGIQVSRECDELASSMSEAFPGLCIKHCTSRRKDWPQATIPAVICTKWL